ncbi:hypothetical protein KM043_005654 [Ampulex compressa]|nr:hypothetical protein KM043_005654 [Ampulex compressa]
MRTNRGPLPQVAFPSRQQRLIRERRFAKHISRAPKQKQGRTTRRHRGYKYSEKPPERNVIPIQVSKVQLRGKSSSLLQKPRLDQHIPRGSRLSELRSRLPDPPKGRRRKKKKKNTRGSLSPLQDPPGETRTTKGARLSMLSRSRIRKISRENREVARRTVRLEAERRTEGADRPFPIQPYQAAHIETHSPPSCISKDLLPPELPDSSPRGEDPRIDPLNSFEDIADWRRFVSQARSSSGASLFLSWNSRY